MHSFWLPGRTLSQCGPHKGGMAVGRLTQVLEVSQAYLFCTMDLQLPGTNCQIGVELAASLPLSIPRWFIALASAWCVVIRPAHHGKTRERSKPFR
jgi:hypothetical protein